MEFEMNIKEVLGHVGRFQSNPVEQRALGQPHRLKSLGDDSCSEPPGAKPFSFQTLHGAGETAPHKDFLVAAQALNLARLNFFVWRPESVPSPRPQHSRP